MYGLPTDTVRGLFRTKAIPSDLNMIGDEDPWNFNLRQCTGSKSNRCTRF